MDFQSVDATLLPYDGLPVRRRHAVTVRWTSSPSTPPCYRTMDFQSIDATLVPYDGLEVRRTYR